MKHHTIGTTSACAENTKGPGLRGTQYRNYLRVRGEYKTEKLKQTAAKELPPRARRIPSSAVVCLGVA